MDQAIAEVIQGKAIDAIARSESFSSI